MKRARSVASALRSWIGGFSGLGIGWAVRSGWRCRGLLLGLADVSLVAFHGVLVPCFFLLPLGLCLGTPFFFCPFSVSWVAGCEGVLFTLRPHCVVSLDRLHTIVVGMAGMYWPWVCIRSS